MTAKRDDAPAFPTRHALGPETREGWRQVLDISGMTLRDWFAGQAMASLVRVWDGSDHTVHVVTQAAYAFAESMLGERTK